MAFDFKRHLIKVQGGRTYLPVSARIVWFREEHPDWTIETEAVEINHEKQYAIFRARISDADGRLMATGTKKEDVKGFGDYIEKAETGSVGRALALCGFGTQFSPELDESTGGRFADSPQPMGGGRFGGGSGGNYGSNQGGGSNRYGGPPPSGNSNTGNGDGIRFTPPREVSPPRQVNPPPAERSAQIRENAPAPARTERPRETAAPQNEAARPIPARPTSVVDEGEDDFEALISGEGLLDATEDDPFGDATATAPKSAPKALSPGKPEGADSGAAKTGPSGTPACVGCGKALTKAQQELSIRNYGEALCPVCQRDKTRRPAMAER